MYEIVEQHDNIIQSTVDEWLRTRSWRLKQDREDLIQECRLRAWRKAHRIDPHKNPAAYIRVVCRDVCGQYAKRLERDPLGFAVELVEDMPDPRFEG